MVRFQILNISNLSLFFAEKYSVKNLSLVSTFHVVLISFFIHYYHSIIIELGSNVFQKTVLNQAQIMSTINLENIGCILQRNF